MARRAHLAASPNRVPMPSVLHEVLRELFAKRPDLLSGLLAERLSLPATALVALDSELTDARLKQLLPDAVLASPNADAPTLIVIVEVHLHVAEAKRRVWPQYAAAAFGRFGCEAVVVVVTPSPRVAAWASEPIVIGPRHTMSPEVLGPSVIPWVDGPDLRRTPVTGMLWTLSHLDDPACPEHALATLEALATWDEDADGRLADILQAALPAAVRARMEELMRTGKYEYQSDFAKKYFALGREEGRAVGEVSALLLVLRARGIDVPGPAASRIEQERDAARIESWIRRAVTASTIDDVFADE